jgi:hypothetical protein
MRAWGDQEVIVPCDPRVETCDHKIEIPPEGCCCIFSQTCGSTGEWGACD